MSEADLQAAIQLRLGSHPDVRLFRNSVGAGWTGKTVRSDREGNVLLANARPVTFGLAPGSSDLIGFRDVLVQPHHIGRHLAVWLAVEVKGPATRITPGQIAFIEAVRSRGGLAGIAKSVDDALGIAGIA